jgi:hypothetical protein
MPFPRDVSYFKSWHSNDNHPEFPRGKQSPGTLLLCPQTQFHAGQSLSERRKETLLPPCSVWIFNTYISQSITRQTVSGMDRMNRSKEVHLQWRRLLAKQTRLLMKNKMKRPRRIEKPT